jgi:two-component system, cell cycle sensor histidine kinase PleC
MRLPTAFTDWAVLLGGAAFCIAWMLVAVVALDGDAIVWAFPVLAIILTAVVILLVATRARAAAERAHLDLRVSAASARGQIAERARGRALGVMSAEFRTPLNAIMVFAELLSKGFVDGSPKKRTEYAHSIFTTGQQLIEKLDALLDQARLEAGELQLQAEEVDPKRLLDIVARLVEADARANAVALELPSAPTPFLLLADSRRLKHIFATLLANAVRLTRREGCVSVEMRATRDGGGEIIVAHTGTGMTEHELEQALDPVAHADGVVSTMRESSWRGLWLAKSLTELHGGGFAVRSAPSAGTTVSITFPRERCVAAASSLAFAAD